MAADDSGWQWMAGTINGDRGVRRNCPNVSEETTPKCRGRVTSLPPIIPLGSSPCPPTSPPTTLHHTCYAPGSPRLRKRIAGTRASHCHRELRIGGHTQGGGMPRCPNQGPPATGQAGGGGRDEESTVGRVVLPPKSFEPLGDGETNPPPMYLYLMSPNCLPRPSFFGCRSTCSLAPWLPQSARHPCPRR